MEKIEVRRTLGVGALVFRARVEISATLGYYVYSTRSKFKLDLKGFKLIKVFWSLVHVMTMNIYILKKNEV